MLNCGTHRLCNSCENLQNVAVPFQFSLVKICSVDGPNAFAVDVAVSVTE